MVVPELPAVADGPRETSSSEGEKTSLRDEKVEPKADVHSFDDVDDVGGVFEDSRAVDLDANGKEKPISQSFYRLRKSTT